MLGSSGQPKLVSAFRDVAEFKSLGGVGSGVTSVAANNGRSEADRYSAPLQCDD
jgi:hypothetical protein